MSDDYTQGVLDALYELASIFDGVQDTDLWKEHHKISAQLLDDSPEGWYSRGVRLVIRGQR